MMTSFVVLMVVKSGSITLVAEFYFLLIFLTLGSLMILALTG